MLPRAGYIYREMVISMAINTAISIGFVFLVFHGHQEVPLMGWRGAIADTGPQSFMVTLMSWLVPSVLTRRRLVAGHLWWHTGSHSRGAVRDSLSAILLAILVSLVAVAVAYFVLPKLVPGGEISFDKFVFAKALYGALLAAAVTGTALTSSLQL
jgi:hypothetical protein